MHYATVAGVVELVLYFRWSIKGPRSGRLVPSRTRPEIGFVVERRLRKSAPVVEDLVSLAPSSVVGT